MAFLAGLKDFFLPSEEVSRERRLDVFGTESKTVAGVAIVGAAAAAIAAPAVIAGGGLRALGAKIAGLSVGKQVALAVAAPIAVGAIVNEPKVLTRTAGGIANFEGNLYELGKNPSLEKAKDIFTENPIIAGAATATGLAALGGGIANAVITAGNTAAVKANTLASIGAIPTSKNATPAVPANAGLLSSPPVDGTAGSSVPLTPETQVLGRQVRSAEVVPRSRKKKAAQVPSVRVQVLNQNTYIDGR